MKVKLWFVRETYSKLAKIYTKIPPSRNPEPEDEVCVPNSVVTSRMSMGKLGERGETLVTVEDWWADKHL